jgi:Sugar-specific transcriptional regulator TrmB
MYLALLNGPRGAREAAEIAGLHRATGYRVLVRLLDRGLVVADRLSQRRFRAVRAATLFQRLEVCYRDETEILTSFAEAFEGKTGAEPTVSSRLAGLTEPPRILGPVGRSTHSAIVELSHAKRAVAAVVRPMSTPVGYRNALARALGQLARSGVFVRLITDALPADYRFSRVATREAGGAATRIQIRHYCPVFSHLYLIDRQAIVRIPTLGTSSRAPPVGVVVTDRARVQAVVTEFETLWTAAARESHPFGSGREAARSPPAGEDRAAAAP